MPHYSAPGHGSWRYRMSPTIGAGGLSRGSYRRGSAQGVTPRYMPGSGQRQRPSRLDPWASGRGAACRGHSPGGGFHAGHIRASWPVRGPRAHTAPPPTSARAGTSGHAQGGGVSRCGACTVACRRPNDPAAVADQASPVRNAGACARTPRRAWQAATVEVLRRGSAAGSFGSAVTPRYSQPVPAGLSLPARVTLHHPGGGPDETRRTIVRALSGRNGGV